MNRFKKRHALLMVPLVAGALVLFPLGSFAQVPPGDVPANLETAIESEIEGMGQTYAGLCHAIEQSDHVGEWCATVQSLSDTEAEVTFGAVASDEVQQMTFVRSGQQWSVESETPATNTPQSGGTTTPPPATATPRPSNIQAPNTGSAGLR